MSLLPWAGAAAGAGRRRVDVLYVSLGTTLGLRSADQQLVATMRAAGLEVELVQAAAGREVRTMMLTDLVQAHAAGRAAREALTRVEPRQIIYSSTTAAMCWPRPGAIRFDALAQVTRPGHHGLWQRVMERRRLRQATVLIPCADGSLAGAPADLSRHPTVVVPIPLGSGGGVPPTSGSQADDVAAGPMVNEILDAAGVDGGHPVAVTYAADAHKKGLDRVLAAWAAVRKPGEILLVAGRADLPGGVGPADGVRLVGVLPPATFQALVRGVGVLFVAPRREDYGLVQLEALAHGARVVTTAAPGPYAALPLLRVLWPEQVVPDGDADDPAILGAALRHAVDARPDAEDLLRATAAVRPWEPDEVLRLVQRELAPMLLGP